MRPRVPGLTALSPLACVGLTAALLAAPAASQTVAAGFAEVGGPELSGAWLPLSNGDFLVFDGQFVERYDPAGGLVVQLADLGASFFTGCLAVDPTESFAIVGESSNGDLFRVDLAVGGATPLAQLVFNASAAFSPSGDLVVSAAPCGFSCGTKLFDVDPVTGVYSELADFPGGSSGPVAFDAAGNLYYGWVSGLFPAPQGSGRVLLFPAPLLSSPTVLTEADSFEYAAGFDALSSLVVQAGTGTLFVGDTDFTFGQEVGRVRRVGNSVAASPVLFEYAGYSAVNVQGVSAPQNGALLTNYQPAAGGRLYVSWTDFNTFASDDTALEPARPELALAGAGTTGPGPFTLELSGSVPSGFGIVLYGPTATLHPTEFVATSAPLPLFTDLDLGTLNLLPQPLVVNGAGAASKGFVNPGGLEGLVTLQVVALDGAGNLIGTSNSASL